MGESIPKPIESSHEEEPNDSWGDLTFKRALALRTRNIIKANVIESWPVQVLCLASRWLSQMKLEWARPGDEPIPKVIIFPVHLFQANLLNQCRHLKKTQLIFERKLRQTPVPHNPPPPHHHPSLKGWRLLKGPCPSDQAPRVCEFLPPYSTVCW